MLLIENDCAPFDDAHRQPVGKAVELTPAEPGNILKATQFTGAGYASRRHLANLSDALAHNENIARAPKAIRRNLLSM
jgi:hypothetical protein